VVGALIKKGEEHPVLKKLWSFNPENTDETMIAFVI
jgi:hypothetical protein